MKMYVVSCISFFNDLHKTVIKIMGVLKEKITKFYGPPISCSHFAIGSSGFYLYIFDFYI